MRQTMKTKAEQKEYLRQYYLDNKEKLKERARQQYKDNPEPYKERARQQRHGENRQDYLDYMKKYNSENRKKANAYIKNKLKTDPNFRMAFALRNRLRRLVKGEIKTSATLKYLGCTLDEFKSHLESQFTPEMSWDNYGSYWHIDHIIPARWFDLSDEKNIYKCFNYSNMQPLEAKLNLSKQDMMPNGKYARNDK